MEYTKSHLPKGYKQYSNLTICSNSIKGGGHILSIGNVLPIIIGKGPKPQVWLQVIASPNKNEFISIVENSVSKNSAVKVFEENGVLTISAHDNKVMSVRASEDGDSAIVEFLDMRPIGFNVYGDKNSLNMGNSKFSGNSMSGGGVLFGVGM
ncbi:hypothetical protein D3C85_1182450 [compost metagenome]